MICCSSRVSSPGLRGLKIDCGCFRRGGPIVHTHYLREIARDSVFFLLAAFLALRPSSRFALDTVLPPRLTNPA